MKSPRGSSRPGLDVMQQLRVIVRLAGAHSLRAERSTGVPGAELWALHEVVAVGNPSVGDLAARLRAHQTTTSNLLLRLEDRGLVKRARSASDQRIVLVRATAAGKRLLQKAQGPTRGLLPHVLDTMSPAQLRKVYAGLAVLLEAMGDVEAEAGRERPPIPAHARTPSG